MRISKESPNKPKGKYLLTYFLGVIPDKYEKQIEDIVSRNNLEIVNLGNIKEKVTYETGPCEFIDLINDCSVFCTDSFHGTVFSILLEKPFVVYERIGSTSIYSRIKILIDKFDLDSRNSENISSEELFKIEFLHPNEKIEL